MDPDANLEQQRRIRDRIKDGTADARDRARLRELQAALREWRSRGGFAPRHATRATYDVKVGGKVVKRGFYDEGNAEDYARKVGGKVSPGKARA